MTGKLNTIPNLAVCPWASHSTIRPGFHQHRLGQHALSKVIKVKADNSEGTDLVDHPGAIEVPIFRRLPPAEARGSRAGLQGHFQGDVPAHVAGVAEEELLKETPGEAAIERIL